jgi:hypothetical protein
MTRMRAGQPTNCGSNPGRSKNLLSSPKVQTRSKTHSYSYSFGTKAAFTEDKAVTAWRWSFTSIQRKGLEWLELYLHNPVTFSWRAHGQLYLYFFHGATATSGPGSPYCRGSMITLRHTLHTVGLLWTSDRPYSETSTWQHTTLNNRQTSMPLVGIRTRNPSKQAAADPRLRARGHWDRSFTCTTFIYLCFI